VVQALGHFVVDTLLVKSLADKQQIRKLIVIPIGKYCNSAVKAHLSYQVVFLPHFISNSISFLLSRLECFHNLVFQPRIVPSSYKEFDNLPSLFSFSQNDKDRFWRQLSPYGLAPNDRIIVLGVRNSDYTNHLYPSMNFEELAKRNSDFSLFHRGVRELSDKGWKVVRMGRFNEAVTLEVTNFFDYASSDIQSDELDCFILSEASMMFSSGFGLDSLGIAAKKKVFMINSILPMPYKMSCYPLMLPKLISLNNNLLRFTDLEFRNMILHEEFNKVEFLSNSEDDIANFMNVCIEVWENPGYLQKVSLELENHINVYLKWRNFIDN
jgi:putative glycosyltransferase (TIGR04372 family)